MADKFGEAVLVVKADDAKLKETLKRDESIVAGSAAKMQSSLGKVNKSTVDLGAVSSKTTASLGVLGASMSLIGGEAGAALGPVVGLGTALVGLALPIAAAIAAAALLGGAIAAAFNIGGLMDWIQGLGTVTDKNKELSARLKEQEDAIRIAVKLQEQRAKIARGEAVASDFIANKEVRIATKLAESAEARKASLAAHESEVKATEARINALNKERLILTGQKKEHDFIKNALEREAFLSLQKARNEKAAADAAKQQADAKKAARAAEGPQTFGEARGEIADTVALIKREGLILARRRSALSAEARRLGLTQKQIKAVSEKLGLGFDFTKPAFETLGTSGSVSARSFTSVASISGVSGNAADRRREKQLAAIDGDLKEVKRAVVANKPKGVAA